MANTASVPAMLAGTGRPLSQQLEYKQPRAELVHGNMGTADAKSPRIPLTGTQTQIVKDLTETSEEFCSQNDQYQTQKKKHQVRKYRFRVHKCQPWKEKDRLRGQEKRFRVRSEQDQTTKERSSDHSEQIKADKAELQALIEDLRRLGIVA